MATIAQLATIFTVDNSQFKAGLRDSEKRARNSSRSIVGHTKNMARSFRGTINSVFNLRTAVATLAGSAGIGLLIKNELNAIDQTAKFSRTLGVTTEDLVSYRHAASLAGVEQSVMDSSMTALIKRLGELRSNTGPMVTFFKKYDKTLLENIKTQENAGGAMAVIAEAIKNAANEADAAAIANAAFSRQGVKMAEIFRERGAAALKEAREEADRLGITFNAFDASQVEMANDAINRMQKSFKGVTTQLTIELAPIITAVSDKITEMQIKSGDSFSFIKTAGKAALSSFKALADGVHTLIIAFQGLRVIALGASSAFISFISEGTGAFHKFANFIIDRVNDIIKQANKIPGVDAPLFQHVGTGEFTKKIHEAANTSVNVLREARKELDSMMMEELPSQAIDKFIQDVKQKTAQAREAAASGMTGTGVSAGGEGEGVDSQEKKSRERKLEMIRQSMMTEMELERQQHEKKIEFLQETDESLFEHEAEKRQLIQNMEAQHQERLNEISANGQSQMLQQNIQFLKRMEQARAASGAAQVNIATDALQQMTAAGATESKKMFKINKAAAIANAIVSTYQGAAKAMEWGFPMGPIFAALMIASGLAQVKRIKSQQFQGGGAGGGGGGGAVAPSVGATPAPPVTPVNNQGVSDVGRDESRSSLQVFISGPVDRQYLKDALLPAMQEEINENDVTFINANSAQARELNRA